MKYSEAKKRIKELSSKYDIDMSDGDFNLVYKGRFVSHTYVIGHCRYTVVCDEGVFSKLPFSDKVYMILSELAMTPLNERADKKKQYVKVFDGPLGFLNLDTATSFVSVLDSEEIDPVKTKFTDDEIESLKERNDIAIDWDKVKFEDASS